MTKHDLPYGVERSGRGALPFKARLKDPITGERWRGGDGFPGSKNFADEWEADAWRRGKQRELDALYSRYQPLDTTTAAGRRRDIRLSALADAAQKSYPKGKTTGELYNRRVKFCAKHLGDPLIRAVTEADAHRAIMSGAASTRPYTLSALRTAFKHAVREGWIDTDPTAELEYVQPPRKRQPVHLTDAQTLELAEHLPPSLAIAAKISHWAGLRVGEILGLRADQLRLDERGLFVSRVMLDNGELQDFPKGREVTWRGLTAKLADALAEHIDVHGVAATGELVHLDGRRMKNQREFRTLFYAARDAAGMPSDLQFRDGRPALVTRLARSGAPVLAVMDAVGHKNVATTQRYYRATPRRDQLDILDKAFG
ncbi:hypothetical protein GCM10022222_57100 [Amycolatopsis ultiminotia]|uniref:Tyr recombinase domain-containing protein n=1 Tax=Amycolatopsis ultiminotia TaxID=543629 RepID=A0ABP6XEV7_9PSEU